MCPCPLCRRKHCSRPVYPLETCLCLCKNASPLKSSVIGLGHLCCRWLPAFSLAVGLQTSGSPCQGSQVALVIFTTASVLWVVEAHNLLNHSPRFHPSKHICREPFCTLIFVPRVSFLKVVPPLYAGSKVVARKGMLNSS